MIFANPEPAAEPVRALLLSSCDDCGAAAAVLDDYVGPVRCAGCWSIVCGTDPMRPIVPTTPLSERRFAGGRAPTPSVVGYTLPSTPLASRRHDSVSAGSPYRVLIAAREATGGQIPTGAAVLLAAARTHGRETRATYALAEELATGRMTHSCAVRVAGLGWAIWRDGTFDNAHPDVNAAHFLALATGAEYVAPPPRAEPPKGPCPRCGHVVRWKLTPLEPYKHNRDAGGEGGRNVRTECVPVRS